MPRKEALEDLEAPVINKNMNIIIPMAGRGSRLRPHTLTIPKPLIPVGGKPIVHRLVEDIAQVCGEEIKEIAFVVGAFGAEVEAELIRVAEQFGAKGSIHYQHQPLGTGHAVLCAKELLHGPVVVAFADTLFQADFKINPEDEGILWVKQIEDPSQFGVVQLNAEGVIIDFIEKPQTFISDLAMIGVYYFKDGARLHKELNYLVDHSIIKSGEYQLPDALRRLTEDGCVFRPGKVNEWLDCGNKEVTVYTNQRVLEFDSEKNRKLIADDCELINSKIIEPCFIGNKVSLKDCVIGPHVSIGSGTKIEDSTIKNCIIQQNTVITNSVLQDSMIGSFVKINNAKGDLSLGDYSSINA